jgi:hypothetical protein
LAQTRPEGEPPPGAQARQSYVPANGFVPTAVVATRIAEAVLTAIYGEPQVQRQLPLTAMLQGDVWVVEGTLPRGSRGGVAHIEISKLDGKILFLSHGR